MVTGRLSAVRGAGPEAALARARGPPCASRISNRKSESRKGQGQNFALEKVGIIAAEKNALRHPAFTP
eukprot:COSAG06_NODE_871_length_11856_cov_6.434039_10_plen_68_part_00